MLSNLVLTASGANPEDMSALAGGSALSLVLMIGFMILIFYFFMLRPQKKKEQAAKKLRDNIQIGDEVCTIGGIIGIVVKKAEDNLVIETGTDRSKLRVRLWAIAENMTVHDVSEETLAK
jgi:preprotein translocase subunit YajC